MFTAKPQYTPTDAAPWNRQRVVHLHHRAGFAATWIEIERDLRDGPQASIDRLLAGRSRSVGTPEDEGHIADLLAQAAIASRSPARLKAWWVYRMLLGSDALTERIALLWHNHFATSNLKVGDPAIMHRQNELFRRQGRGPFGELLKSVVKDPAILLWLDAAANRKEHPNENLAREVMELFTLGVGNYTEKDVKEAARALTGWSVKKGAFRFVPQHHDEQSKTILTKTGQWKGDDLLDILLQHPATSLRLAGRVCELFMGEASAETVSELAMGLRENKLTLGWAIENVLRSPEFFAEINLRRRVKSPAVLVVGAARALEMFDPPPSTLVLAEWSARMGQDLFYPPNVFGWPGGRAWITTRSLLSRANFASALVNGAFRRDALPLDALGLAKKHDQGGSTDDLLLFFSRLLLGADPPKTVRDSVVKTIATSASPNAETARKIVTVVLASPEAQIA